MTDHREAMSAALETWIETLEILISHLTKGDVEAAHEAVLILLLQGLDLFGGPDSVLMKQCFPVLDAIKKKVDVSDLDGALRQSLLFRKQLEEIRSLMRPETGPVETVQTPSMPPAGSVDPD